jgi:hypothetical protein
MLVPLGYLAAFRRYDCSTALVMLLVPASFLAINSGYFYWDGGASTGPRHIVPCLPFLAFTLVPLWDWLRGRITQMFITSLLLVSITLSLMAASVTMAGANRRDEWLLPWLLDRFAASDVHNVLVFADRFTAGVLTGRSHLWTLLGLPTCWAVAFSLTLMIGGRPAAYLVVHRNSGR